MKTKRTYPTARDDVHAMRHQPEHAQLRKFVLSAGRFVTAFRALTATATRVFHFLSLLLLTPPQAHSYWLVLAQQMLLLNNTEPIL